MISRISSRVPLYCIVIDQINKLPEDGLKPSRETSRYIENSWKAVFLKITEMSMVIKMAISKIPKHIVKVALNLCRVVIVIIVMSITGAQLE